jgi:hypothetical protein
MLGYQYQDIFMNNPEMKPVRAWVESSSKNTYLSYLITHPIQTLGEPFNHLRSLLDSSNVMYSYPRNPLSPLPAWITTLTKLLYPHGWIMLVLFIFAMSTGCVVNWKNDHQIPIWAVIAVMFIGILPLMYVTWYGEPMEIERHSIELSAQLRLGGWLAFIYLLDEALEKHLIETFLQKLTSRMKTGTFKTKKNEV